MVISSRAAGGAEGADSRREEQQEGQQEGGAGGGGQQEQQRGGERAASGRSEMEEGGVRALGGWTQQHNGGGGGRRGSGGRAAPWALIGPHQPPSAPMTWGGSAALIIGAGAQARPSGEAAGRASPGGLQRGLLARWVAWAGLAWLGISGRAGQSSPAAQGCSRAASRTAAGQSASRGSGSVWGMGRPTRPAGGPQPLRPLRTPAWMPCVEQCAQWPAGREVAGGRRPACLPCWREQSRVTSPCPVAGPLGPGG